MPLAAMLQMAVVAALLWVIYWDVLVDMAWDWWNVPALSQGMLLPPLALYLAWTDRARVLAEPVRRDLRGLLLLAFACVVFLAGRLASEFFMARFSFVLVLTAVTWTFWGLGRVKLLVFPLLLLATMVPLPTMVYNALAAPLQLFASDVASQIAQSAGISVYRDGNIIHLASGSLGVAEACSGLNSLSALIVGAVLLGFLLCRTPLARVLLFLAAMPLAVAINVLRVAGTAILADYNQEYAMGFYHTFSGWLVFVVGFALLYVTARLLMLVLERKPAL